MLQYPNEWKQLLNVFGSCFTKPQFNNFCQTTTSMAVSQYSSVSRWSQLFEPKHQSSLNDFLTQSPWDESILHSSLSRTTIRRIKDIQIGIIDDTLSHKPYSNKISYVDWFYDGLTKQRQKGNSIVTHGVISSQLGFIPFDIQLYKKNDLSKNDIACAMIKRTQKYVNLQLYLVDSWYSNTKVLGTIKRNKSHYITEIKSNRNVNLNRKCRYIREHEKHIEEKQWIKIKINEDNYRYFQTSAFISRLGNINLVFSQKYEEKKKEYGETYYLITDLLSVEGQRVIELFLLRGKIESFHRESKQQLGLEHYQLRNSRGIERYIFLVLLVFVLLILLNQFLIRNTFKSKTIGELRIYLKAICLTTVLQAARHYNRDYLEKTAKILASGL